MEFHVGQCFDSLQQLEDYVDDFEKSNLFNLTRRDSKKFESAMKTKPRRLEGANEQLKFYYLKLCCNFGGKSFKKRPVLTDKPRSTKLVKHLHCFTLN